MLQNVPNYETISTWQYRHVNYEDHVMPNAITNNRPDTMTLDQLHTAIREAQDQAVIQFNGQDLVVHRYTCETGRDKEPQTTKYPTNLAYAFPQGTDSLVAQLAARSMTISVQNGWRNKLKAKNTKPPADHVAAYFEFKGRVKLTPVDNASNATRKLNYAQLRAVMAVQGINLPEVPPEGFTGRIE